MLDSLRLTVGLPGLIELYQALRSGNGSTGDIKGSLYVEVSVPEVSLPGRWIAEAAGARGAARAGRSLVPKGKADFVAQLSITMRLERGRLVLKEAGGVAGVLVSQQSWKGFGVGREAGYTGILLRTAVDPINYRVSFGLSPLGGQANGLLQALGKGGAAGSEVSTPFMKLNGYFFDTEGVNGAGGPINPWSARVAHELVSPGARAAVNLGRFATNVAAGLSTRPRLVHGRPQENQYAGSGFLTVGAPLAGIVIGPTIGLQGNFKTVADGDPSLVVNLPGGNAIRVDLREVVAHVRPIVDRFAAAFRALQPDTAAKVQEIKTAVAAAIYARADAERLRTAAAKLPRSEVSKWHAWTDYAASLEREAARILASFERSLPQYFEAGSPRAETLAGAREMIVLQRGMVLRHAPLPMPGLTPEIYQMLRRK